MYSIVPKGGVSRQGTYNYVKKFGLYSEGNGEGLKGFSKRGTVIHFFEQTIIGHLSCTQKLF